MLVLAVGVAAGTEAGEDVEVDPARVAVLLLLLDVGAGVVTFWLGGADNVEEDDVVSAKSTLRFFSGVVGLLRFGLIPFKSIEKKKEYKFTISNYIL